MSLNRKVELAKQQSFDAFREEWARGKGITSHVQGVGAVVLQAIREPLIWRQYENHLKGIKEQAKEAFDIFAADPIGFSTLKKAESFDLLKRHCTDLAKKGYPEVAHDYSRKIREISASHRLFGAIFDLRKIAAQHGDAEACREMHLFYKGSDHPTDIRNAFAYQMRAGWAGDVAMCKENLTLFRQGGHQVGRRVIEKNPILALAFAAKIMEGSAVDTFDNAVAQHEAGHLLDEIAASSAWQNKCPRLVARACKVYQVNVKKPVAPV